jgi:hypothetical protein
MAKKQVQSQRILVIVLALALVGILAYQFLVPQSTAGATGIVLDAYDRADLSEDINDDVTFDLLKKEYTTKPTDEQVSELEFDDFTDIENDNEVEAADLEDGLTIYLWKITAPGYTSKFVCTDTRVGEGKLQYVSVALEPYMILLTNITEAMGINVASRWGDVTVNQTVLNRWNVGAVMLNESINSDATVTDDEGVEDYYDFENETTFGLAITFTFNTTASLAWLDCLESISSSVDPWVLGANVTYIIPGYFTGETSLFSFKVAQDLVDGTGLNDDFELERISIGYAFQGDSPTQLAYIE